jgi:hypothetical protein
MGIGPPPRSGNTRARHAVAARRTASLAFDLTLPFVGGAATFGVVQAATPAAEGWGALGRTVAAVGMGFFVWLLTTIVTEFVMPLRFGKTFGDRMFSFVVTSPRSSRPSPAALALRAALRLLLLMTALSVVGASTEAMGENVAGFGASAASVAVLAALAARPVDAGGTGLLERVVRLKVVDLAACADGAAPGQSGAEPG